MTATSQAGRVRLIHASALSGARVQPWRNPAPTMALISRGATGAMRCAMRFERNISCFEMLASGGAGPLTMAQPTRRSPRNLADPAAFGPPLGVTDHREAIDAKVVGQLADVARPALIAAS